MTKGGSLLLQWVADIDIIHRVLVLQVWNQGGFHRNFREGFERSADCVPKKAVHAAVTVNPKLQ